MANQTHASIYEVDDLGEMGAWVGQGSLVEDSVVLVHPSSHGRILNGHDANGHGVRGRDGGGHELSTYRVRITPPSDQDGVAEEIIDGHPVTVGSGKGDESLIALELESPAHSRPDDVPGMADAQDADAVFAVAQAHVNQESGGESGGVSGGDSSDPAGPPLRRPNPDEEKSPWCLWLGIGCPKR